MFKLIFLILTFVQKLFIKIVERKIIGISEENLSPKTVEKLPPTNKQLSQPEELLLGYLQTEYSEDRKAFIIKYFSSWNVQTEGYVEGLVSVSRGKALLEIANPSSETHARIKRYLKDSNQALEINRKV